MLNDKIYPDSEQGCKNLLNDNYEPGWLTPTILHPDPYTPFVWLAIDSKKEKAAIIWLKNYEAEEVPYKGETMQAYF